MRFTNVNPGEHPEYIIVGLGNVGPRYDNTRHNIGFEAVDYIDSQCDESRGCKRKLHSALCDKCVLDGYIVYIVKPQTFMNNSGMAVQDVLNYYKMSIRNLIVIHDDITLPSGEFRIKKGGGASGHNGIKSIMQHVGSDDFVRIRVGVGIKPDEWDMSKYVLSKVTPKEKALIEGRFGDIKDALGDIFKYNVDHAIKVYNPSGSN